MSDYSLELYSNVLANSAFTKRITDKATEWFRSRRLEGGYWLGSFKVFGEDPELRSWLYERLGFHVLERTEGQVTWEGIIYEVDHVSLDKTFWKRTNRRGRRIRRSYDLMWNRVRLDYVDPDDDTSGSTAWATNAHSVARHGQKDQIIQSEVQASRAVQERDAFLALHSAAQPILMTLEEVDEPYVEVSVLGYAHTAQWRFATQAGGTTTATDVYVKDLINNDCEYLNEGIIQANADTLIRKVRGDTRTWDLLQKITRMEDTSGNHYILHVGNDRQMHYQKFDPAPIGEYFNGELRTLSGESLDNRPRFARPGVYRDIGRTLEGYTGPATATFLSDSRDFIVAELEVDAEGKLVPRLGVFDSEEALRLIGTRKLEDELRKKGRTGP